MTNHNTALLNACLEPIYSLYPGPFSPVTSTAVPPTPLPLRCRYMIITTCITISPRHSAVNTTELSHPVLLLLEFGHSLRIVYYYSKSPAVSKFGLSLVPLNPSTFNRVYKVGKGGILVRSRDRDGPAVAGAAIVMHYCIMSPHNYGSLPAFSQFLPPVA